MCSCYKEREDTLAAHRPKMNELKKEELSQLLQSHLKSK